MAGVDDAKLMVSFAAGEEWAVRAVCDRFAGPILTVALAMLGKRDLADEAVQMTLLNAWRGAGSYDPSRELAPWVYAIARRAAVDIHRRERRVAVPVDVADEEGERDVEAVSPLSFERTWEAWQVRSALAKLPPVERDVLRLVYLAGMTHREAAGQLRVPLGTVKSRSARAHGRLVTLLGHMVTPEE